MSWRQLLGVALVVFALAWACKFPETPHHVLPSPDGPLLYVDLSEGDPSPSPSDDESEDEDDYEEDYDEDEGKYLAMR